MIRESLEGKRVLLTGATGFLGSALLERLVVDVPVERVDVLVRGNAQERLQWLLSGSVFGPARQRLGNGLDDLVAQKVRPVSADLSEQIPEMSGDIDLVIHSAATVSFDPPIDQAFATNLRGTLRLYQATTGKPFIHVSTAYVAGITRGTQPEELLEREIDWRAEAESAERMRQEAETDSRRPEVLDRLEAKARGEMGRAGPQSVAKRAEELRIEWVERRLVDAGRARARSLGWPDVYTFTKALTEIALDEIAGEHPLSIIRPSIIESAIERPYPGWIEGFRMADPVMLAFGRGALPEFPGIPEGVLDLIPVDMVVNCILVVAARDLPRRSVYHVCSGHQNPLKFRGVYEHTREYFLDHPLPDRDRGTFKVPEWSFPGRRAVDKKLQTAERLIESAERLVGRLPRNRFARETARKVDRFRRRFDFVKRYADLYGPYVEAEVIYTDNKARALFESLPEGDQNDFNFDPTSFTWHRYLQEVHLPMLTAPLRWPAPTQPEPAVRLGSGSSNGKLIIAAFDVEGTIVSSNVPESYLWLRLADADGGKEKTRIFADLLAKAPGFLKAERRDRGEFIRQFYRQYEGITASEVRGLATKCMSDFIFQRLSPAATRRIREHRRLGHRVIFITGSLDFIVEPLRVLADEMVTAHVREVAGLMTGDLDRPPLVGEARASWLRDYAEQHGAHLEASYAYADSMSDLPMLEAVGNPVAVNPDVALHRIARKHRWPVEEWRIEAGAPKLLVPSNDLTATEVKV